MLDAKSAFLLPLRLKNLKRSFRSREQIKKKEHGPYFMFPAIQASSATLTTSGPEVIKNNFMLNCAKQEIYSCS